MTFNVNIKSFPLPYDFPDGKAWAAIKCGAVVNMVYMALPEGLTFSQHRYISRGRLAREGEVWAGRVVNKCFVPDYESTDIRHSGECNTARLPG
jgi:hypothetical protein